MKRTKLKAFFMLHLLLLVMAFSGVMSKFASRQAFLSLPFILFYCGMLLLLGIYAIGWQQVLKRLDLSVAFANRACSLAYSLLFGALIFHEEITVNKVIGCILAIAGVLLYISGSEASTDDA